MRIRLIQKLCQNNLHCGMRCGRDLKRCTGPSSFFFPACPQKNRICKNSEAVITIASEIFLTTVSDVVSGIQEGTVADDFKVTVVSRSPSGLSDITDDLSLRYLLTGVNSKAAAMRISGLGSIPMIDQDIISVTVGPACISDCSAFGSPDGGSGWRRDVGAGVSAVSPDWAGDVAAVDRPDVAADVAFSRSGTGA